VSRPSTTEERPAEHKVEILGIVPAASPVFIANLPVDFGPQNDTGQKT
jgi:hypothetical protein